MVSIQPFTGLTGLFLVADGLVCYCGFRQKLTFAGRFEIDNERILTLNNID
jgi:hypothetical protein